MYVHILLPDETESKDEDEEAKLNAAVRWAAHPYLQVDDLRAKNIPIIAWNGASY